MCDFLGDELRMLSHAPHGPLDATGRRQRLGARVVKRMAVPPGTNDAIMTVGLLGATGTLDIDGLTIELVPVGGAGDTNLIVNGDFELGDPFPRLLGPGEGRPPRLPREWLGRRALELGHARSQAMAGVATRDRPARGARGLHGGPMLGHAQAQGRGDGQDLLPG